MPWEGSFPKERSWSQQLSSQGCIHLFRPQCSTGAWDLEILITPSVILQHHKWGFCEQSWAHILYFLCLKCNVCAYIISTHIFTSAFPVHKAHQWSFPLIKKKNKTHQSQRNYGCIKKKQFLFRLHALKVSCSHSIKKIHSYWSQINAELIKHTSLLIS